MRNRALWLSALTALAVLLPADLLAQERRISGQITRAGTDVPVSNAEVSVVGQVRSAAVLSDSEGRFSVVAPPGEVRLQVRALGYTRADIAVPAGVTNVTIELAEDVFKLDELVVSGQVTSVERRSAPTAIAYVSGDEVSRVSSPSIMNAMAGRITGVNLQTNSGAPGGGIQMQVRGNATLLGGYDPLFVVDGVVYSNASIPSGRGLANNAASPSTEADPVNRIADLNPADIASIEVLKGAAASSIYGSKAANGVVVITTKRGQIGTPRMNVTQRFGYTTPLELLEMRRWTEADAVATYGAVAAQFFADDASPYFNHYEAVYDNRGLSYETIADVSGGTDNTRYFVSGTIKHDEGIERNTGAGRESLRANIDQNLGDAFDLSINSVYNRAQNDRGWNNNCNNYGCHGYAIAYIPSFINLEKRNPDGSFPTPALSVQSNPIQLTELGVNHEETNRFSGGVTLGWDAYETPAHTLRILAAGGLDAFDQKNDVWSPNELFFERPQALPGEAIESGGRSMNYNWSLNGIHTWDTERFTATTSFGYQYADRRLSTYQIRTQNLLPGQRNVNRGTNTTATENLDEERTMALYVQEGLRLLDDRLFISTGVRAERSSVNGDIDKYFVYPKVSGSYRLIDLIGDGSEIKLRAAYGETGNQPIFGQKFTNLATPQLGGQQGLTPSTASGSPVVEPERLKEIEGGVDGFMLGGRLNWEMTFFQRNTTNLLLQRVPAPSSGFASQTFNGGRISNKGIEAAIGYSPVQSGGVQWITRATFTRYTSEVEDLAGLPAFFPASSGFGNLGRSRIEEGKAITQLVGFRLLYDNAGDPVRGATLEQLGNSAPDFRVGFVNDVSFGVFNVNAVVDWQRGGDVINLTQFLIDDGSNAKDYGSDAWQRRIDAINVGAIDPFIEDASFVKLRELSIMADVPRRLFESVLPAESLRIGLTGRNLWMWKRYTGLDPEVANFGPAAVRNNLDIGPYPPSRNFYLNISVGF